MPRLQCVLVADAVQRGAHGSLGSRVDIDVWASGRVVPLPSYKASYKASYKTPYKASYKASYKAASHEPLTPENDSAAGDDSADKEKDADADDIVGDTGDECDEENGEKDDDDDNDGAGGGR